MLSWLPLHSLLQKKSEKKDGHEIQTVSQPGTFLNWHPAKSSVLTPASIIGAYICCGGPSGNQTSNPKIYHTLPKSYLH